MNFSETRFVKIEGTHVSAAVDSIDDAKVAVKELRHKKKEYAHHKRALVRQRKAVQAQVTRAKRKVKKPKGFLANVRSAFDTLAALKGAFGRAGKMIDLPRLERECRETDEILHNIDTVLLQIQGKLI